MALLFDFEIGLFGAVGAVPLGPFEDLACLRLGVPPPQAIDHFDSHRREHGADEGHDANDR